jgi:hypothetical protein
MTIQPPFPEKREKRKKTNYLRKDRKIPQSRSRMKK